MLWRKQKAGELDFEKLGIVLPVPGEIPLLVVTMLFSYKGRGFGGAFVWEQMLNYQI